jgi:formyl-CoA transferase
MEPGLGVLSRNPKLVLVRISGYGQTGPYKERLAAIAEARAACATSTASPTGLARPNLSIGDTIARSTA